MSDLCALIINKIISYFVYAVIVGFVLRHNERHEPHDRQDETREMHREVSVFCVAKSEKS